MKERHILISVQRMATVIWGPVESKMIRLQLVRVVVGLRKTLSVHGATELSGRGGGDFGRSWV